MVATRRTVRSVMLSMLSGMCLWSCGDGDGGTAGPSTVPQVVAQGAFSIGTLATSTVADPCDFIEIIPFTTNVAGTLDVTVDWTFDSSNLDVGIFEGNCTCQLLVDAVLAGQDMIDACTELGASVSVTEKPESVTVPGRPAGSHTMIVLNNTGQVESCSYQIVLTPSA
jgi:hypothetical protein